MVKVLTQKELEKVPTYERLEIPSFRGISEHSDSKFSSTVVKVFTQKQILHFGAFQTILIQNFLQPW